MVSQPPAAPVKSSAKKWFALGLSLLTSCLVVSNTQAKDAANLHLNSSVNAEQHSAISSTNQGRLSSLGDANPDRLTPEDKRQLKNIAGKAMQAELEKRKLYRQALKSVNFDGLLDAGRIKADKNWSETKTILQQAYQLIKANRQQDFYTQLETAIQQSTMDKILVTQVLQSFQAIKTSGMKLESNWWDLEKEVIAQGENIVDFMANNPAVWRLENDSTHKARAVIIFKNQAAAAIFQGYLNKAEQLKQQQSGIGQQETEEIKAFFGRWDLL